MMHVTFIERLMEWGFLSLETGDLKEELIVVYSYPTGEGKREMHSGKTRSNGCKLELWQSQPGLRNLVFHYNSDQTLGGACS